MLVDVPFGEAVERLLDHDLGFESGQARAEAEVDAVAERDVAVEGARDVEAIGVGVLALVAAGAPGEQRDLRVRGNRPAVPLDVAGHEAGLDRRRRLVAQELLDRVRDERRVGDELGALLGMAGEEHRRPTEQAGGGLAAGELEQREERHDLAVVELARACRRRA